MNQTLQPSTKVKLHFLIKKKVQYGFALYVIGNIPILGNWHLQNCLKLNWNQDDIWSGFTQIQIFQYKPIKIFYKYIISAYQQELSSSIVWQDGQFNRMLIVKGDQNNIIIGLENIWNMNKICLNLLVPKSQIKPGTEIYLAGGCNQLGNWRNNLKMSKTPPQHLSSQQLSTINQSLILQQYQLYSVILNIQRNLKEFNYYFLKKQGNNFISDRIPSRQFKIHLCENKHPTCLHIGLQNTMYQLLELSKFQEIYYSKILENLYIGGSIETCDDVKQLKKKNINNVLYIASSGYSYQKNGGLKKFIKMISQENKMGYYVRKVQIGRLEEVLGEVRDVLALVQELLQPDQEEQSEQSQQDEEEDIKMTQNNPSLCVPHCLSFRTPLPAPAPKILYIYCSTGKLLSPLIVSLYLHIYKNYTLKNALEFVKEKHPISAFDTNIMNFAVNFGRERIFKGGRENIVQGKRTKDRPEKGPKIPREKRNQDHDGQREDQGNQNLRNFEIQEKEQKGKFKVKDSQ